MALDKTGKELPKGITWREDKQLYMARFSYQGTPYTFYEKTLAAAKKVLKNKRYEIEHGLAGKANKMTLNEWYETWFEQYKQPTVKETTLISYAKIYKNNLRETIGTMPLSKIKPLHIQQLYNQMLVNGVSPNYISIINAMLYNIFKIACINDLIPKNPCDNVIKPKTVKSERRVLTIQEQDTLLIHLKQDKWNILEPFIVTLLGTGMRCGEACGLTWNDVDFEKKEIYISKTLVYLKDMKTNKYVFKYQTPKSTSGIRTIPMLPEVEAALKRQRLYQRKSKLYFGKDWKSVSGFEEIIFTSHQGTPWHRPDIAAYLKKLVQEINQEEQELAAKEHRTPVIMKHIYPHAFRHSFATRCFELDMPPKTVQQLLGHSSIEMTMDIYTHVSEEKKRQDMKKLNGLFKIG